jgi:hypothetical protein
LGIPDFANSGRGLYHSQNLGFGETNRCLDMEEGVLASDGEGALRAVGQLKTVRRAVLSEKFKSVSSAKVLKVPQEAGVLGNARETRIAPLSQSAA